MIQTILDLEPFNRHTAFTLWKLCAHKDPNKKPFKTRVHDGGSPNHSNANPARLLTAEEARRAVAAVRAAGTGHGRMGEVDYVGIGFLPGGTGLAWPSTTTWTCGWPSAARKRRNCPARPRPCTHRLPPGRGATASTPRQ